MKNTAAQTAVERDRKFALPVAPNRLPDAPLPNEAPMSAPLPCCTSTRPIMTSAARICSATTRLSIRFIRTGLRVLLAGAAAQCAARQMAANSAAVEDAHVAGVCARRPQLRAQQRMHLLRLLGRGGAAGADGPDRLVGHDDLRHAVADRMDHRRHLALDHIGRAPALAIRERLAHA